MNILGDDSAVESAEDLPATLPVLPLRETVPFPDTLTPIAVGQERSIRLVNDVLAGNRMLVMVASTDPDVEAPGPGQLHRVGVVGQVARMMKIPDGTLRLLVQGGPRVELGGYTATEPYLVSEITPLPDLEPRKADDLRPSRDQRFPGVLSTTEEHNQDRDGLPDRKV